MVKSSDFKTVANKAVHTGIHLTETVHEESLGATAPFGVTRNRREHIRRRITLPHLIGDATSGRGQLTACSGFVAAEHVNVQ